MATKVLVVDSTEGISDMLNFSRTADYDVFSAVTAKDAIKIMDEKRPQLLVCDVNIPDMDGIEFLCHIKKRYPTTEVVMISDDTNKDTGFQCLKYEASDFIVKPVTNASLEIVLERAQRMLAIKKKLNPSLNNDDLKEEISFERLSIAKQIITKLSLSQIKDKSAISNIISIHNTDGLVIEASPEYIDLIGDIEGKKSWDMYTGEASTPEMCPSSFACSTKTIHIQKATLKTKDNKEIDVEVFAAPLVDANKRADLIVEIINL